MDEDMDWPDCIVPGCTNKCCLRLNSDKCWPHTTGAPLDHDSTEIEREIYEIGIEHEEADPCLTR